MSRVDVKANVKVYEYDDGDWGAPDMSIDVETFWNDISGQWAVLVIGEHRYTVSAKDLRIALDAVTRR